ncbi:hypothetical protein [uncultured Sulfitobacter sp.]|uniref:hypothetical protein n=1 Tax=uncultured Sulfitobacter sp. TaxID=191468 RepID=UPI002623454B|nr:hypothetical protein [uncultured Sulfitobacter sp.]
MAQRQLTPVAKERGYYTWCGCTNENAQVMEKWFKGDQRDKNVAYSDSEDWYAVE